MKPLMTWAVIIVMVAVVGCGAEKALEAQNQAVDYQAQIDVLETRIEELEQRLNMLDVSISEIERGLSKLDISATGSWIDQTSRAIGIDRISRLEERLQRLENNW